VETEQQNAELHPFKQHVTHKRLIDDSDMMQERWIATRERNKGEWNDKCEEVQSRM
jgi:hypothetical protein